MIGRDNKANDPGSRWELAAHLVRERRLGLALAGGGLLYFLLASGGVDLMPCPLFNVTGLPCPGCGMTRSCLAMLQGNWAEVWRLNPFGPVFAVFWAVVVVGIALPQPWHRRFAARLGRIERRTRWAGWLAITLAIYGLTRWI